MTWKKTPADRKRDNDTYGSPEYRRNKRLARQRSGGRCEIRDPGTCIGTATQIDHIVPLSQGGTHDLANLRDTCAPCHARKTASEGAGYRRTAPDPEPLTRTTWT